jgi:hypothetical protein
MRRMSMVGILVVGALALGGVWAGAAGATLPEVGRCVAESGEGEYKNSNCTEKAGKLVSEKSFEFVKGAVKKGFSSAGGEGKYEGAAGNELKCTGFSAKGEFKEVSGAIKEVQHVVATFTGCAVPLFGAECHTAGAGAGEIVTKDLTGPLKYTSGQGLKTPVVNQGLKPEVAKKGFAQFECPALGIVYYIGEGPEKGHETILGNGGPVNVMSTTAIEEYVGSKGVQSPQHVEGSTVVDNLEQSLSGPKGTFERSDLVLTVVTTYEEEIEIKA